MCLVTKGAKHIDAFKGCTFRDLLVLLKCHLNSSKFLEQLHVREE